MKILVTGGAGFIGSALIRHLISATDACVLNVDKLTYAGNLESLGEIADSNRYAFSKTDICDQSALEHVFQHFQPDAVIHLAAESHVDRSIDGPGEFVRTNLVGTYQMLQSTLAFFDALDSAQADRFRFLHVSTDEVFGDLENETDFFRESTSYNPSSPYSATKAGSDHLVRAWGRTYGLPILVTNCSNNYGPYQFPEKLIPHVILNALEGESLPVYGDGCQVRDWLYVDDHAVALWNVLTGGIVGETYNIGGHNEKKNIDVVRAICNLLESLRPKSTILGRYEDLISHVSDRPGHDNRYAIDATKIEHQLGWKPTETFETGLKKTVVWYLENRTWWERVLNGEYRLTRIGNKGSRC